MFERHSADTWHWSEDARSELAFCVHALTVDGLTVPPFDAHSGGDGRFRDAGLDASGWLEWIRSLIGARDRLMAVAFRTPADRDAHRAEAQALGEDLRFPGRLCTGSDELRERLNALWLEYQPRAEAWRRLVTSGVHDPAGRFDAAAQRWLWNALLPFHRRLPTLSVYLVDYPSPAVLPLPPTDCLIAPVADRRGYAEQVLAAAEALGGASAAV